MKTIAKAAVTRAKGVSALCRRERYQLKSLQSLFLPVERHLHLLAALSSDTTHYIPILFAAFHTANAIYLVMEYSNFGTLWDRMCGVSGSPPAVTTTLPEAELKWWAPQMVEAISWVHNAGFAHRFVFCC